MITIGIDPGLDGAISVLNEGELLVYDMPLTIATKQVKSKRSIIPKKVNKTIRAIDIDRVLSIIEDISNLGECQACIEIQRGMPDQNSTSVFTTGFGYGIIKTAIRAFGIPLEEIQPQEWQKHFSISKNTKADSCTKAEGLFPNVSFRGPRGKALDGRSDSALICLYYKRKTQGDT